PRTLYNYGTALLATDSLTLAAEALERTAESRDPELRYRALFNFGLAHLERGLALPPQQADEPLDAALAAYKKVLLLRPDDLDAKWNYELALRKKQQGGGGGGGGGGQSEQSPAPKSQAPKPSGGLAERQAEQLRGSQTPRLELTSSSTLAEYRFTLTTNRIGRFVVPPFQAMLGAQRVASRPLAITVRPPPAFGRSLPAVVARARIDTGSAMDLRMREVADTLYVGQQATYEVAVFLNQAAREKLRRNPTFYPPEMQAMLAYDLPAPPAGRARTGSQCFDALVYRRALFPLVSGRLVIPPAQLVYSTSLSPNSLLSR